MEKLKEKEKLRGETEMELFFLLKAHRKYDNSVSHRLLALGPSAPRQDPCVRSRGRMESLGLPAVTLGDGTTAYLQQAGRGNRASGCQGSESLPGSEIKVRLAKSVPHGVGAATHAWPLRTGSCWICTEV